MRKAAGLTQQHLAEASGLSKATLSKIELGQISSPISTFSRIAKCLNLTFEDFIRTSEPMNYLIIRKDDPRPLASQKAPYGYRFELLGERWPNKNIVPYMITYDPDPRNKTRPNFKHEMDEFIYVLEGSLDYYYENEIFFLEPGDSIFIDGSRTHGGESARRHTLPRALVRNLEEIELPGVSNQSRGYAAENPATIKIRACPQEKKREGKIFFSLCR